MIVVVNKYFPAKGFSGISLWPFIFLKRKELAADPVFLHHEKIHLQQQLEMLILPFYVWYLLEFLFRWVQKRNKRAAYLAISFEKEAYLNENDFGYYKKRRFWAFLKYV